MQFCSIGHVVDALLAIPATDSLGTGAYLASGDRPAVEVSDGPWPQDVMPIELVCVGISATDVATGQTNPGQQSTPVMGKPLDVDEEYGVLSWIRVYDGDSSAQKKVRDRALELFQVFQYALRVDPSLGIVNVAAWIDNVDFTQEDPMIDEGAVFWLAFTVHIKNRLVL